MSFLLKKGNFSLVVWGSVVIFCILVRRVAEIQLHDADAGAGINERVSDAVADAPHINAGKCPQYWSCAP